MFTLSFEIDGEPRPGSVVTITVSATALAPSKLAELSVLTPEMEAAKLTAWDQAFRIPVNTPLPARFMWKGALGAGQTIRRSVTMIVPTSGFYRVTARIRDASGEAVALLGGHLPQTASEQEKWIFADEDGGRILDQFDASQIPAEYLPLPGPRRSTTEPPTPTPSNNPAGSQLLSGNVLWQFLYFDTQAAQYRPILYAQWSVEYRQGLFGPVTGTDQGATDLNGYVSIDCRPNERYAGLTQTWGSYVRTSPLSVAGWNGQFNQDCGQSRQAVLTSDAARVYAIMSRAAYDANIQFGFGRGQILAEIVANIPGSYYSPSQDKIVMRTASLPDEFGRFAIAHEYGHAYHNVAMGGINPGFAINCTDHHLELPSSYGCALAEGFADFFSVYLTGSLLGAFESNIYHTPGVPNPMVEGAVAATFLDVVDAANVFEGFDGAQWNGSYLPRLVGTCEYWDHLYNAYFRATGIDHITYCLEQDIDPFAANLYAFERITPTGWRHSATLPGTWSKAVARPLWYTNIFQ